MKKAWIILICVVIVCTCACARKTSGSTGALPPPDGAKEISVEISVAQPSIYETAAKKFEQKTGVKVKLINARKEINDLNDLDVYMNKVRTELIAGKGADIYECIDHCEDHGKQGQIIDMSSWIKSDTDLSADKVFKGILYGSELDGHMYSVPISFDVRAFVLTPEAIMPKGRDYTWEEFVNETKNQPRKQFLIGEWDTSIFWEIFNDRVDEFIDEKKKTQNLDSDKMKALLKEITDWRDSGICLDSRMGGGKYDLVYNPTALSKSVVPLCTLPDVSGYTRMIPEPCDGKEKYAEIMEGLSINASSKYKRTAYDFIKFMLTDPEVQESFPGMTLSRQVMQTQAAKQLQDLSNQGVKVDMAEKTAEVMKNASELKGYMIKSYINEDIIGPIDDYFMDKISMDDAMKQMAQKVDLYLKEQK